MLRTAQHDCLNKSQVGYQFPPPQFPNEPIPQCTDDQCTAPGGSDRWKLCSNTPTRLICDLTEFRLPKPPFY